MIRIIRQLVLIPALLGIALLGLSPTTAEASHQIYGPIVYQKGSVMILVEPSCTNKKAIIEIQNAIKESWGIAKTVFQNKEMAEICFLKVEVRVGNQFGITVIQKVTKRVFFTFEAIRMSDNVPVYAIASGTYKNVE